MKKQAIFLFIICISLGVKLSAEPIHFFKGSYSELCAEAQRTQKYILLDFYTDWCRPCQVMQRNTFANDTVGEFVNRYFLAYKIDCDKDSVLKKQYKVPTYPHWVVATATQKELYSYTGYADPHYFLNRLKETIGYSATRFAYLEHPDELSYFKPYLQELQSIYPDSARRTAEKFLILHPKYELPPYWELVTTYAKDINSPVFFQVLSRADVLSAQNVEVKKYLFQVLDAEKPKLLRKKDIDGWQTWKNYQWLASKKCKLVTLPIGEPAIAMERLYFEKELDLEWASYQKDENRYIELADELLNTKYKGSVAKYTEFAQKVAKNFRVETHLNLAETWITQAIEWDKMDAMAHYTWAYLRYRKSDYQNAMRLVEKAEKLALQEGEKDQIATLKQKIQLKR